MASLMAVSEEALGSIGKYVVNYDNEEWIKFNYDTGAETTALPVALAEGQELSKVGDFVVASGADIPNYGRHKFDTEDEFGNSREVKGSVTEVHKPLGAGSDLSNNHDAFIWKDGGALVPKTGPVAVGMRREYYRLCRRYGTFGILPLYREGNLYNYYLKKTSKMELAAKELALAGSPVAPAQSSSWSGNRRQARWP